MLVDAIIVSRNARRTPLGGDSVATHRVDFGDHCNVSARVRFSYRDSSSEPGTSTTNQHDIM
jgi:hypothetical protein